MKKIIFWIDDSLDAMDCVVRNLFWDLWDRNCCNGIIFAGNNFKKDGSSKLTITENDKDDFFNVMKKQFVLYCREKADGKNDPMEVWKNKNELLPTEPYYIRETDSNEAKKEILNFLRNNKGKGSYDKIYIGLDIRLFEGDEDHKEKNEKTITMELYNELSNEVKKDSQEEYTVFLYSSYTSYDDVIPDWIERCENIYEKYKNKIYIFDRYELVSRNDKSEEREKFLNLFETKTNEG